MALKGWIELAKPERTFANVITASAGFLLASSWHIDLRLLFGLLIGTSLVIASACVANNVLDRGLDAKMPRTRGRALVTGSVSLAPTIMYCVILGLIGFGLLAWLVNLLVVALGAVAYIDYVVLYGYSKRRTKYSTLVGTVSGSMSLVAGYVAVTGRIDLAAILLFIMMTLWQMPHFYAIAIFRSHDYALGDIPVAPLVDGLAATKRAIIVYIVAFAISCIGLFLAGFTGFVYLIIVVAACAYWIYLALAKYRMPDATMWARLVFKASLSVLLLMCAALAFGRFPV